MLSDNNRVANVPLPPKLLQLQNADDPKELNLVGYGRRNQNFAYQRNHYGNEYNDYTNLEDNFRSSSQDRNDCKQSIVGRNFEAGKIQQQRDFYQMGDRYDRMDRRKKFGSSSNDIANNQDDYSGSFRDSNDGEGTSQSRDNEFGGSCKDLNRNHGNLMTTITSNAGKKSEMNALYHLFSEDMRISKMLRRLCAENNPQNAIELCEKLQIVIMDSSNASYIRRAFDFLVESIISVLQQGPIECLNHVAKVFGMLGYINRHDFPIYKNWIFKNYDSNKGIRIYLMHALKITFKYDAVTLDLNSYSDRLIIQLKDLLESADIVENFIAISDAISEFAKNYKNSFEKHFTDIVDIVVGWHLETEQTTKLKQHCAMVLQSFSEFFVKNFDFTMGLLGQFLEDISAFGDDIENSLLDNKPPAIDRTLPEISVGSFVGAFNSIIKCLTNKTHITAFEMEQNFFDEAICTITHVAYQSLKLTSCQETVQSINEFFVIILSCDRNNVNYNIGKFLDIINLEVDNIKNFNDLQISSLLFLLLMFVKELKSNTPLPFVTYILDVKQIDFGKLKLSNNQKHYKSLIKLYHEILLIKNVPLLQEAYKHILYDIRNAMSTISGQNENPHYTESQAECILNFYLIALSVLATQTSSIIGMYALQPNILELIINDLSISNLKIWEKNPTLHNSIINLLSVHCIKNHNYILSSKILMCNVFSKLSLNEISPTGENFNMILKFLVEILNSNKISSKILLNILNWINLLYQQCNQHNKVLKDHKEFVLISKGVCLVSTRYPFDIILKCAECINTILEYDDINIEVLTSISEISYIHMISINSEIREKYSEIFGKLPLEISLRQSCETTGLAKIKEIKLNELQHWYTSSATLSNLREKYFKNFIEKISIKENAEFIELYLKNIFPKCWTIQRGRTGEFCNSALNDLTSLLHWIQLEAAQYCVNNKLRTSLGKPQETFLKIEAIIKENARILALKDYSTAKDVHSLIANQKHARILLGFLECLEKAIYNASDGTAFAMLSPEKPARTFFRVNASTCSEWFNRIRTAVDLIGLHCMEPEMVIRYSEVMLRVLVSSGRTSEALFVHTLMSYTWALLRNGEPEELYGLYLWTKIVSGKKFAWIKMASEHAAGHREIAADGYMNILNMDEKLDQYIRDFITDQLIDCMYFTGQWSELKEFISKQEQTSDQRVTIPLLTLKPSQIENIMKFENLNDISVLDLTDWEILEKSVDIPNNFSYHKVLSLTENTFVCMILNPNEFDEIKWKTCTDIIHSGIQECLRTKSREHLKSLIILNHISHKIWETKFNMKLNGINSLKVDTIHGSTTVTRITRWADLLSALPQNLNNQDYDFHLDVASMARKEGNFKLCQKELEKFFKRNQIENLLQLENELTFDNICTGIISNKISKNMWTDNILRGATEAAKLLYNETEKHNKAIQLASSCCLGAISSESNLISERISRTLLTLSDWLSQGTENLLSENNETPIIKLLSILPDIRSYPDEKINAIIPILDAAVGKLVQYSVKQSPDLGKAWGALGNWCYRWGRKIVEIRTNTNVDKAGLQDSDIEKIQNLVPNGNEEDVEKIVTILNQHQVTADDEEIGPNDVSSTELIESQLGNIEILKNVDSKIILSIVEIWRQAHKSVYGYYEMAADSYFKYLNLSSEDCNDGNMTNGDCSIVTATLRLLRLVVKHALGLQEVLEEGLATTPTRPWKVIIPQLFSRLNHHELYVRKRVSELLCRVAKDSPHLIIFPAVVGAAQEERNDNLTSFISCNDSDNELNSSNNALALCFNSLLDTLSKQASETVEQVQLLVHELKRVTLLWDEFWLYSLAQLYSEYSELFNTFEAEVRKSSDHKLDVLIEKHRILMEHVIEDMKYLYEITSREAETNYERNFQEKYSKIIETTIEELGKPLNREKPNESWQKIKQLYTVFQQKLQKNSQATLKMADISPVLANMKNTAISMPGVETNDNNHVYIKSVDNIVYILPTKTKPKKLAFFGSDGKRYTYLFKGLEDLHLDERIMQFLSISNSMMCRSNDCNGNITAYRAHHYSVIPLGPRSGLISWVDGVTPIFAIYKKWQQREAANPKKDKQSTAMRASEIFYNKLTPLLAEHNLKITDNRKSWPINVLRKVLEELSNETPRDLLAKELWCNSNNAGEWRLSIRTYSLSVAVMSVIGYVIGLGDRHLDNVLVKLSTGDIVHIDYNVCFEKGKTLRVPEKVPFRMTPNLEEALGVTGIEGTFRLACEHVLKTLRKERETLLTLLEAFVYDPLVDWAVSDDGTTTSTRTTRALLAAAEMATLGGPLANIISSSNISSTSSDDRRQSRKKLENEVMRDTLTSRFAEIKPEWTQYRDEVNEQLLQMTQYLNELEEQREQFTKSESERNLLTKQMAMIREVETLGSAMGSHPLNTLSQRYIVYRKANDEFKQIKDNLSEKLKEYMKKTKGYYQTLRECNENYLQEKQFELNKLCSKEIDNEFNMIKEFLENSAQIQIYIQADQARKELDTSFIQQSFIIKLALDTILKYENVIRYYPNDQFKMNRLIKYEIWCTNLLESPELCGNVIEEFQVMLNDDSKIDVNMENAIPYAFQLEKLWIEANFTLRKNYDILQNEYPETNEKLLKEAQEAISIFLQVETGSQQAIQYAVLSTLCEINSQYIKFEESCLKSLSPEQPYNYRPSHNWILDEQTIYFKLITETINILLFNTELSESLQPYINNINMISLIIKSFKEFDTTFQIHILPNLIQRLISSEDFQVIYESGLVELKSAIDLNLINNKLQNNINCNSDIEKLLIIYDKFKMNFNSNDLNIFNMIEEYFTKIYTNMENCLNQIDSIEQLENDQNFDHYFVSKQMLLRIRKNFSAQIFRQYYELKRIETILEIFLIAKNLIKSFKDNDLQIIFDPRLLQQPISKFLIDYENMFVLGLGPYFVSILEIELLKIIDFEFIKLESIQLKLLILNSVENQLKIGGFSPTVYNCAQTICTNLNVAIKQYEFIENLKRSITNQTETIKLLRLISTVHIWLNEKIFIVNNQQTFGHVIHKTSILTALTNVIQNLNAWQISIQKIHDELQNFTLAIQQRLKWAVGANPNLLDLQTAFNQCVQQQNEKYHKHSTLSRKILTYCYAITTFENLKINKQIITENDEDFLLAISKWDKIYKTYKQATTMITPVEEALVQLLDPEGTIDHFWIGNIIGLLDEMIDSVQSKIANIEKDLITIQDNLQMSAHKLRSLMASELRMEVRFLLKLILKIDSSGDQQSRHKQFQGDYKEFLSHINDLHIKVLSKDFTEQNIKEIRELINELLIELDNIYNDLLKLVVERNDDVYKERKDRNTNDGKTTGTPVRECKKGNQPEQKRNAYAVSVWRRIRMKLEGRDPDPNRRLTISEQVDWMIREAMNPDNLAVLYEGWTPWV